MSDLVPESLLPSLALSVRQPWAWSLIFAGKDIENRCWRRPNPALAQRGRVAVHAPAGMTRAEYESVRDWIGERTDVPYPAAHELVRGAIIGEVEIVDVVRAHESPWWTGPVGLVLRNPRPCTPVPCVGALGFFAWRDRRQNHLVVPAKWMWPPEPTTLSELELPL